MKNILLLGDSIKENYQEYVCNEMKEYANVYYTRDNGKFSYNMLRYLHEWINAISNNGAIKFDVIHFNCGLWDVLRLSNEDDLFVSKEQYKMNLQRIADRLHFLSPASKLVFALTTEVIEPGFEPGVEIGERRNSDIEELNRIAIQVFDNTIVEINDLYSVSKSLPAEAHSDLVHFDTEIGMRELGDKVVECLIKYCDE